MKTGVREEKSNSGRCLLVCIFR